MTLRTGLRIQHITMTLVMVTVECTTARRTRLHLSAKSFTSMHGSKQSLFDLLPMLTIGVGCPHDRDAILLPTNKVLRLTSVMRLSIDHSKSWHWGYQKKIFEKHVKIVLFFTQLRDVSSRCQILCQRTLAKKVSYDKSVFTGFSYEKRLMKQ